MAQVALKHPNPECPALPQTKQRGRDRERTSQCNILEKYFPKEKPQQLACWQSRGNPLF